MEKEKIVFSINIRLPKQDKVYFENQIKKFCSYFDYTKISVIQFGKQDIRGTESICVVDKKQCVPIQKYFNNKFEMLGFIQGFIQGKQKTENCFKEFAK